MQVTETLTDGLKRGYEITITGQELDAKVTAKLEEARPEIEMKGFRKGKVPMAMLRKRFGTRILGEAMQEAVDGAMSDHFEKTGDRPAMQPKVEMKDGEDWKEGDDMVVAVDYEALPEIPEVDLASIKLERLIVKAEDSAVTEALQDIAASAKTFEDRAEGEAVQDGDQVVIDFEGFVDGKTFEGGKGEGYPLELGSNAFIPGFEDQLIGARAGDDIDVTVTFPAEYGAEHLAGKEALFKCRVNKVKAPKAAEISDELARQSGAEDLPALKTQIAKRLEAEYAGAARQVMKRGLLDHLDEAVKFDLPPSLVQAEAGQIAHQLYHEENPDDHGHEHGEIEPTDEHRKLAERRVRLGLLLAELGRKREIEVTDADMTQAIMNKARQYPGQERAFFEFVQKNAQMQQQIRAPIFEDKVVDYIAGEANVAEKDVSKDDLQKAIEALDEI